MSGKAGSVAAITGWYCQTCGWSGATSEFRRHESDTGHRTICPPGNPLCDCSSCNAFRLRAAQSGSSAWPADFISDYSQADYDLDNGPQS